MAQTGYTPIKLYYSITGGNTPTVGNLNLGEIALNLADQKVYALNAAGNAVITLVGTLGNQNANSVSITGGSVNGTTIGATTASTGAFTTISASGVITSTVSTGTAPFTVSSTTQVANLNAATAGTATNATNTAITDNTSSSATWYPTIVSATTGNLPQTTSSTKLSFVPSTGTLSVINLGVGITSPGYTLDVQASGTATARIKSTTATGSPGAALILQGSNNSTNWQIGASAYTTLGGLEFASSTTNGGTTFTTPAIAFTNAGNIQFYSSNSGIVFDNSSATVSSTLNDYEVGTWTPNQGSGLTVTGTFSSNGSYVKVGKLVTVNFRLQASTIICTSTGVLTSNLPFAVATDQVGGLGALINNSGAIGDILQAYSSSVYPSAAVASTPAIYGSVTYFATF